VLSENPSRIFCDLTIKFPPVPLQSIRQIQVLKSYKIEVVCFVAPPIHSTAHVISNSGTVIL